LQAAFFGANMLSLVSVVNDPIKMEARLLAGLRRQNAPHQLIVVDNQDRRFPGASTALNWGARQAVGNWIVFLHQDVELLGADWLERTENWLSNLDRKGWHGVVGRNACGRWRGLLRDRAMVFGEPFDQPIEVQTLDEVLLVHANCGTKHVYFDEGVPGWHAYGVDVCCTALRQGAQNYVLPVPIWHDSSSTNRSGLGKSHAYVWEKHRQAFRRIYTTCGILPHPFGWTGSWRVSQAQQKIRHLFYAPWRWPGGKRNPFSRSPWEVVEEWTRDETAVDCLHEGQKAASVLTAAGFTDFTRAPRQILHHFCATTPPAGLCDCVVIAPELARRFPDFRGRLPRNLRRLIVCLYLDDCCARSNLWQKRLGRNFQCELAIEADETRWAILEARL
jgi:hypothetical protein